jgi:hypothetical protein
MGDPVTAPVAEITDLARRRADRPARALGHPAGSAIGRDVDATVRRLPTATAPAGTHEVTVRPPLAPSPGRVESRTAADSSPAPAPTGSAVGLALAAIRPPAGPGPVGAVARGLGTTSTPAETFATELARHRVERPRPLPVTFRPLATAIVGERQVHVSSGTASRKALAKVGKRAATTGDTIHLATPRPTTEVLAHELTHVAHPSPVPRFFDDDDRGPEERQAEQVAAVIRRAPILLRPAAATATTIQRRADPPRPEPGTVSAAALAAQLTASPASGDVIQRQIGAHRRRGQTAPPVLTAAPAMPVDTPSTPPIAQPAVTTDEEPGASGFPDLSTQFDRILELLEERVLRELERRGGRFRGGF